MKRPSRCLLLPPVATACIMALLLAPSIVMAGAPQETIPGDRVRVRCTPVEHEAQSNRTVATRMHPGGGVTGAFMHARGDSLTILTDGGVRTIPTASISRIERSAGTRTHTLAGALIGGGVMTVVALMVDGDDADDIPDDRSFEHGAEGLLIGIGVLAGALVGHLSETEQWEPATVPGLTVGVTRDAEAGAGIAVSVSF